MKWNFHEQFENEFQIKSFQNWKWNFIFTLGHNQDGRRPSWLWSKVKRKFHFQFWNDLIWNSFSNCSWKFHLKLKNDFIYNSFYYAAKFSSSENGDLLLVNSWSCDLNGGFSLVDSPSEIFFNGLALLKKIMKIILYNDLLGIMI